MLKAWVTEPSRMKDTAAIRAASGVWMVIVPPYVVVAGAEVIVGRGPLKR